MKPHKQHNMKNYYDILGITPFEDNQDTILSAYKVLTLKFEKSLAQQDSTKHDNFSILKNNIIKLNEAFLVLSDRLLKIEYDKALCNNNFSNIENRITQKRNKASEFVNLKISEPKENIGRFVCITAIIIIAILIVVRCVNSLVEFNNVIPTNNTNWQRYDYFEGIHNKVNENENKF